METVKDGHKGEIMKKALLLAVLLVLTLTFGVSSASAACYYPKSQQIDYWQHHYSCVWDPDLGHWACIDFWQIDGTCDIDCDGNRTCSGDTEIRSDTQLSIQLGPCPRVCE